MLLLITVYILMWRIVKSGLHYSYRLAQLTRTLLKRGLIDRLLNEQEYFTCGGLFQISIYTLSDLGDLSNLIGSLSRTIQQYSPPSEWIMCELSVFPIF